MGPVELITSSIIYNCKRKGVHFVINHFIIIHKDVQEANLAANIKAQTIKFLA